MDGWLALREGGSLVRWVGHAIGDALADACSVGRVREEDVSALGAKECGRGVC